MEAVELFVAELNALDLRKLKFELALDIIRCLLEFLIALLLMKRTALDFFTNDRLYYAVQKTHSQYSF